MFILLGMAKDRLPANRLRELREHQGISLDQLAAFCGVNVRTLYRWERGDSRIPDQQKALLCDLFGVSLDHLMRRDCAGSECSQRDRDEGYEGTRPTKPDHNVLAPPQTETPGGSPPPAGGFGFLLALIRWILRRPFLLLLAVALVFVFAPVAEAHRHHCRRGHVLVHHRRRPHWRCVRRRAQVAVAPTPTPTPPPVYYPPAVGADNEACLHDGYDPGSWTSSHGANIVKLIVPAYGPTTYGYGCLARAEAEGYRVILTLMYPSVTDLDADIAFLRERLAGFAPLHPWAVAIGNENDLDGVGPGPYRTIWNYVEPFIPSGSLHVFGEASPWGFRWLREAYGWGGSAPGVDAFAFHSYHTTVGGLDQVPEVASWARSQARPLWLSECAPAVVLYRPWLVVDTPASWQADLRRVLTLANGEVKVLVKYYWPALGGDTWAAA